MEAPASIDRGPTVLAARRTFQLDGQEISPSELVLLARLPIVGGYRADPAEILIDLVTEEFAKTLVLTALGALEDAGTIRYSQEERRYFLGIFRKQELLIHQSGQFTWPDASLEQRLLARAGSWVSVEDVVYDLLGATVAKPGPDLLGDNNTNPGRELAAACVNTLALRGVLQRREVSHRFLWFKWVTLRNVYPLQTLTSAERTARASWSYLHQLASTVPDERAAVWDAICRAFERRTTG